jgi:hypothetical protein
MKPPHEIMLPEISRPERINRPRAASASRLRATKEQAAGSTHFTIESGLPGRAPHPRA